MLLCFIERLVYDHDPTLDAPTWDYTSALSELSEEAQNQIQKEEAILFSLVASGFADSNQKEKYCRVGAELISAPPHENSYTYGPVQKDCGFSIIYMIAAVARRVNMEKRDELEARLRLVPTHFNVSSANNHVFYSGLHEPDLLHRQYLFQYQQRIITDVPGSFVHLV